MPFTSSDLLLSDSELAQITDALENTGENDPIARVLAECEAVVADYTARFELTEARRLRLVRGLAPAELYRLASGTVPEHHEKMREATMRELEGIRDGKFPDLAPAQTQPTPAARAKWGSRTRLRSREEYA